MGFSCVGDTLRWSVGDLEVVAEIFCDQDADVSYLDYEDNADRKAAYKNGEFEYYGIVVRATLSDGDTETHLGGESCWGYESDSDEEYFKQEARDMAESILFGTEYQLPV